MKVERSIEKAGFYHYYPVVPVVVAVKAGDQSDALACAWYTALSFDPPLFGVAIAPKRHSYQLLKKSGEFTANFLTFDNVGIIATVGRTSGKEINKFSAFRIKTRPSTVIKTPVLKDAYAAYECRIVKQYKTGDHIFIIGEVVAIHSRVKAFNKKDKMPDLKSVTPALYLGADNYIAIKSFGQIRMGKEEALKKGLADNHKKRLKTE